MEDSKHKIINVPIINSLDCLTSADSIINVLDEKGARQSIDQLNWADEFPYKPLTTFTVAHSGTALYVDFLVRANFLRAENYLDQSPVSQDSCVEVFLQPQPEGEYWNFEFNCIGTINASHRLERNNPTRLTGDELALVRRYPSWGTRPFRELEGLFVWDLLAVIPFNLIGVEYKGFPIEMRGNFYKCASATSQPHYLSWNPIESASPDFHRPQDFGTVVIM